jgi:hypothetical protein
MQQRSSLTVTQHPDADADQGGNSGADQGSYYSGAALSYLWRQLSVLHADTDTVKRKGGARCAPLSLSAPDFRTCDQPQTSSL